MKNNDVKAYDSRVDKVLVGLFIFNVTVLLLMFGSQIEEYMGG